MRKNRIITLIIAIITLVTILAITASAQTADDGNGISEYSTHVIYGQTEHVKAGDADVTQDDLNRVEEEYMMLPGWVRDVFENKGWQLWIVDNFEEYGFDNRTAGLTVYAENCVFLRKDGTGLHISTLYHEVGHVLDWELRSLYSGRLSGTSAFKDIYTECGSAFCSDFGYSHYDMNEKEIFAEACYYYWTDPYELRNKASEIFTYIDNAFTEYSGVSVFDGFPVNGLYDMYGSLTYYKDGVRYKSYSGFADYNGDKYYVTCGYVLNTNDIKQDPENGKWYYIVNGKVDTDYTGVSNFKNQYGWWYIKNGVVDFTKTGIEPNQYGWWRVVNGKVDFACNSVEQNDYGWWYLTDGKVRFDYTGTGDYCNSYGWWYIKDGKVDFSRTGIEPNGYGWWRVVNGKVDFSCNSVEQNDYGWWYLTGGKVDFDYTGVADYANAYGWWYINKGKVDFSYTGRASNRYGTWLVRNGKVDFSYTGVWSGMTVRAGRVL